MDVQLNRIQISNLGWRELYSGACRSVGVITSENGPLSNSLIFMWCWLEATKTMTHRTLTQREWNNQNEINFCPIFDKDHSHHGAAHLNEKAEF